MVKIAFSLGFSLAQFSSPGGMIRSHGSGILWFESNRFPPKKIQN
jgi:hypothetical protein